MATVIESIEGHYEVQKTSYGEAYVWCSEGVVVECDCGERPVLSASETLCSCGADHAALVWEVLDSQRAPHPWEGEYQGWRKKQEEHLTSEETYCASPDVSHAGPVMPHLSVSIGVKDTFGSRA